MERKAIKALLEQLRLATEKAQRAAEQAKESENESSKSAATSWSAAGEREYTRQQAKIAKENLEKLEGLGREVGEAVTEPVPEAIRPVCLVTVEYEDGARTETFYFVSKSIYLNGLKLISPESPIGGAVAGISVGDSFEYKIETVTIRGKVVGIE